MGQLNIHMTPAFEATLAKFIRARGIRTKSEAVRLALEEALAYTTRCARVADFAEWLGVATGEPRNPPPRFPADRDLWT
jgi:hypothetical protein